MTKFIWTWELGDCFPCWAEDMLDNSAFYSNTTELNHPPANSVHSPDLRNATAVILNGVRSGNDKQPSSLTVSQEASYHSSGWSGHRLGCRLRLLPFNVLTNWSACAMDSICKHLSTLSHHSCPQHYAHSCTNHLFSCGNKTVFYWLLCPPICPVPTQVWS